MSDQQDEQKFGLEGIEQSQGYSPMPMANPDPDPEPALTDEQLAHWNRPQQPPPVERSYNDVGSGEPTPDNQTVEIERASRDISEIRAAERAALEQQRNADLNEALDYLRSEEETLRQAMQPQPAQPVEQQPEQQAQPELQQPQPEAVPSGVDPEIAQALQNPKIRNLLEQVNLGVEQTKSQYAAATEQLAIEAQGVITALFPEHVGLSGQQAQGALAAMQQREPQRFEQFRQLAGRAQQLIGVYHQQQVERQQAFAQQVAQQQRDSAHQFKLFATAADNTFDEMNKSVPAETMKAIRAEAIALFKEHGVSETELAEHYNSNPLLRSAAGQQIVSEAARWRLAQKAISQHRSAPVPQVQRPGVSEAVRIDDGAVSAALQRLNSPGGNEGRAGLRNAAALVAARRGGR
jgi:hypothetical protein